MSNKRILEYSEASTVANDDYLYMDGQTNGSQKIKPNAVVQSATAFQNLSSYVNNDLANYIDDAQDDIADLRADLGDLSELETEDTSSIVNAINEVASGSSGSGLTADIKTALLQIAQKVAYIDDDGQDYYDDLYDALYAVTAISLNTSSISLQSIGATSQLAATTTPEGGSVSWSSSNTSVATVSSSGLVTSVAYGSATITATAGSVSATCSVTVAQATCTGISATYTQSGTVYDTDSLDSLKTDLVVTASWSDSTTSTVASADYTLSGTLSEGTSTVTVSYAGQTDTFSVTVSSNILYSLVNTDFDGTAENGLDTGINLLTTDTTFTIIGEITRNEAVSKTGWRILSAMPTASPWNGLLYSSSNASNNSTPQIKWISQSFYPTTNKFSKDFYGTHRFVFRHEAGTSGMDWWVSNDGATPTSGTINAAFAQTNAGNLFLMGADGVAWSCSAHVNKIIIYSNALSNDTITSFLAGE